MFFTDGKRSLGLLSITLIVVVMLSILAIALIFQDPTLRSDYFWMRLLWVELMTLICFLFTKDYLIKVIFKENLNEEGGAMPPFGLAIYMYALTSVALVIITSFLPENDFLSKFHLILQILLFAGFSIIYVLINFALAGALSGTKSTSGSTPPSQLVLKISMLEKRIKSDSLLSNDTQLMNAIKKLKETIQYSIPNFGTYLDSVEYQTFALNIESFCEDTKLISANNPDDLYSTKKQVEELIIIAGSLKRVR